MPYIMILIIFSWNEQDAEKISQTVNPAFFCPNNDICYAYSALLPSNIWTDEVELKVPAIEVGDPGNIDAPLKTTLRTLEGGTI